MRILIAAASGAIGKIGILWLPPLVAATTRIEQKGSKRPEAAQKVPESSPKRSPPVRRHRGGAA